MKYKMIVSDLDDTLLTKEKKISPKNLEFIKKAVEKGCIFAIATGRIYRSASIYGDILGINPSIASCNGAYTIYKNSDILIDRTLDYDQVRKIDEIAENYEQQHYFYDTKHIYTRVKTHKKVDINISFMKSKDPIQLVYYEDIEELLNQNVKFYKSLFLSLEEDYLKDIEVKIEDIGNILVTSSSRNNVEINREGAHKGNAVKELAKRYGIAREDIIAIGDNRNDLSMISYAGLGVAVANASEGIKEISDHVTVSHEEDAIAKIIEEFVL